MIRSLFRGALGLAAALWLAGCAFQDTRHSILISTSDQAMLVMDQGHCVAMYPVSTSRFGLGDKFGSCDTPLGLLKIKSKIGDGAPVGAVFKHRQRTGEVVPVNSPGRDPIVTRILWLQGLERQNARAFARMIYIHGTPDEQDVGKPVSFGCIRMRSNDVIALYDRVGVGAHVLITTDPLPPGFVRHALPVAPTPAASHQAPVQPR